jgi:two-component system, sensor histidine kinase LadS
MRFKLKNKQNTKSILFLQFNSNDNDSLLLYCVSNKVIFDTDMIGESIPYIKQKIKNVGSVFKISLQPNQEAEYYIKSVGNGQPMDLTASIFDESKLHEYQINMSFFKGAVYGIIFLIIIFNLSFYFITKEIIYMTFTLQVIFSVICTLYFDGYIYRYIFPNSGYWCRQTIAIAMCGAFLFSNKFITEFFNLKEIAPWTKNGFKYSSYIIFVILIISFYHPHGYNIFIISLALITSLVAALLCACVISFKKQNGQAYIFILLATISLIILGSVFQVYKLGFIQNTFYSFYSIHFTILTQSIFLALAIYDKFRKIKEDNALMQEKLVASLNEYSQNLITSIESERKRLASDIHDGLGQNLLSLRNIILKSQKNTTHSQAITNDLDTFLEITTCALDEARDMAYNLRPPILSTMGLSIAIKKLIEKISATSTLNISFSMPDDINQVVSKNNDINVYRIFQECFNNILKHAHADAVSVEIKLINKKLFIKIADDGIGYSQDIVENGQGIIGVKERVALLKGQINIKSTKGLGTAIEIIIPCQKQ